MIALSWARLVSAVLGSNRCISLPIHSRPFCDARFGTMAETTLEPNKHLICDALGPLLRHACFIVPRRNHGASRYGKRTPGQLGRRRRHGWRRTLARQVELLLEGPCANRTSKIEGSWNHDGPTEQMRLSTSWSLNDGNRFPVP